MDLQQQKWKERATHNLSLFLSPPAEGYCFGGTKKRASKTKNIDTISDKLKEAARTRKFAEIGQLRSQGCQRVTKKLDLVPLKDSFGLRVSFTKHYTTKPIPYITAIKDLVPDDVLSQSPDLFEQLFCDKTWEQPGISLIMSIRTSYPATFVSNLRPTVFRRKCERVAAPTTLVKVECSIDIGKNFSKKIGHDLQDEESFA